MTQYKLKASDTLANMKQDGKKLLPVKAKSLRYYVGAGKVPIYDHSKNFETLHGIDATIEFSSRPLAEVKKDHAAFLPLPLKGYEATAATVADKAKTPTAKPGKLAKVVAKAKKLVTPKKVKEIVTAIVAPVRKLKTGITAEIDNLLLSGNFTVREAAKELFAAHPEKKFESIYQVCANRVRARKLLGLDTVNWKSSSGGAGLMILIDGLLAKGGKTFRQIGEEAVLKFPLDHKGQPRTVESVSGTIRNRIHSLRKAKKPCSYVQTKARYEAGYVADGILDNPLTTVKAGDKPRPKAKGTKPKAKAKAAKVPSRKPKVKTPAKVKSKKKVKPNAVPKRLHRSKTK